MAQISFKIGLKKKLNNIRDLWSLISNRMIVLGGILSFASIGVYIYALAQAQLTVVYPTYASIFIFVILLSMAMLKEKVTAYRAAGIVIVIIGILLVTLSV